MTYRLCKLLRYYNLHTLVYESNFYIHIEQRFEIVAYLFDHLLHRRKDRHFFTENLISLSVRRILRDVEHERCYL